MKLIRFSNFKSCDKIFLETQGLVHATRKIFNVICDTNYLLSFRLISPNVEKVHCLSYLCNCIMVIKVKGGRGFRPITLEKMISS